MPGAPERALPSPVLSDEEAHVQTCGRPGGASPLLLRALLVSTLCARDPGHRRGALGPGPTGRADSGSAARSAVGRAPRLRGVSHGSGLLVLRRETCEARIAAAVLQGSAWWSPEAREGPLLARAAVCPVQPNRAVFEPQERVVCERSRCREQRGTEPRALGVRGLLCGAGAGVEPRGPAPVRTLPGEAARATRGERRAREKSWGFGVRPRLFDA